MADNTLDILGLQLVNYFISNQNYRPFVPKDLKKELGEGEAYLVNKNSNNYHIIKIIKEDEFKRDRLKNKDIIIEYLRTQLAAEAGFKDKKIRFLMIILNDDNCNETSESPAMDVIVATIDQIVRELTKFYPNIHKFVKVDHPKLENNNENEAPNNQEISNSYGSRWEKITFQNRRYLSETLKKCSNANLAVTWLLFIIPAVMWLIFIIVIGLSKDNWLSIDSNLQNLIFGASFHNLIFGAHQYWRWFTYPFVGMDNFGIIPLSLIFSLWMFYSIGRFIEGFYGWWKDLIIWIGAMVLTGALQSVVDTVSIMSGFIVFVWISLGAMLPFIWNYKLFKTPIMKRFWMTILFIIAYWLIFDQQLHTLLYAMIAFGSGCLFASLVGYHNRKLTLFYSFAPIAIFALIVFTVLCWWLNPYYAVDNNNFTFNTLSQYCKASLMSKTTMENIMRNYFHLTL